MKIALVLEIVLLFIGTSIVSGFDINSTIQDKKRDTDERHPRHVEWMQVHVDKEKERREFNKSL